MTSSTWTGDSAARQPIGAILARLARSAPDRPIVTCGCATVTRRELEQRSNRLARAYAALGVREGSFVAIALPNGIDFFCSAFAVWKLPPEAGASAADNPAAHPGRTYVAAGFRPDPNLSCEPIAPARVSPFWKAPTSGGSTGRPKLIVSGQDSNIDPGLGSRYGIRRDGVQLVPGPLYHNAMLRMWRVLQADPGRYDLRSLRQVWHMAAPCPAWLKDAWIELVGAEKLMELYGGTEGQATTVISGTECLQRRGSVGRPVFGRVRVLDEDGRHVPPGVTGEIYMRWNEDVSPPYHYIGAESRSRDGWESLGDLGWLDQDGYVYLADRLADMIISGGANVYPAEVEAALLAHPVIKSCVVVGLPDEDLGQRIHAIVEAQPSVSEPELRDFLAARIVRYKIPRSFRSVSTTVRDDAGKVRRSAWRDSEVARLGL